MPEGLNLRQGAAERSFDVVVSAAGLVALSHHRHHGRDSKRREGRSTTRSMGFGVSKNARGEDLAKVRIFVTACQRTDSRSRRTSVREVRLFVEGGRGQRYPSGEVRSCEFLEKEWMLVRGFDAA